MAAPFTPKYIIIHVTAGDRTPQAVQATVNQRGTSVHNSIGLDGLVGQHVSYGVAAYGNGAVTGPSGVGGDGVHHDVWWDVSPGGNPNNETISIEHCKASLDNSDALTPEQKAASFALVAWLCERFGIARRWADGTSGITGHYSVDPVNRSRCPGPYPFDELFQFLGGDGGGGGMWTRQADGSGMDARGNHCGQGFMAELEARGETGVDGQMSETYVSGAQGYKSFLPLTNGDVLVWDGTQVTHDGALVCADLYRPLVAAQTPPPPVETPIPDEYVKAKAAIDALKAAGL